jgi:hypothetical protein
MKKNILFRALVAVLAMTMCVSLAGCGDDDDDDVPSDPNQPATVVVSYKVTLGEDWYTFFDLTATYTQADGQEKSEVITKDWEYTNQAAYANGARTATITIEGTPKAGTTYDESTVYQFTKSVSASIGAYSSSNTSVGGDSDGDSSSTAISGTKMSEYLTSRKVASASATLK